MKLLYKSLQGYILYSVLVLLISIPSFYYVIQRLVAEDVDEDLQAQKAYMATKLKNIVANIPYDFLEAFEPDFYIKPTISISPADSLYNITLYDSVTKENVPYRVLESTVLVNGRYFNLKIKSSLVDNDELIFSIVAVQAILMLLIVTGLLLITRYQSRRLWKPFYTTISSLHEYKIESDKSIRLEKTEIEEFSDLNQTINKLTDRNQKVYLSQKEFTENASHEMQTPLAVLQFKLELLMQTSPLTVEQAELITELSETGQRMNRLNKTLLLLSKIENNQFATAELINIYNTFQRLSSQYKNALNQKQITLHVGMVGESVINANLTLIEILLGNLLSNAIRYNVSGGRINVLIKPNEFVISNTGAATQLDTSRLFQRFQKQTNDAKSLGLGLEIAKRICSLYNANINYTYVDGLHLFKVSFNNS